MYLYINEHQIYHDLKRIRAELEGMQKASHNDIRVIYGDNRKELILAHDDIDLICKSLNNKLLIKDGLKYRKAKNKGLIK